MKKAARCSLPLQRVDSVCYKKGLTLRSFMYFLFCFRKKGSEIVAISSLSYLPFKNRKGISTSFSQQVSHSGTFSEGSVAACSRPPGDR